MNYLYFDTVNHLVLGLYSTSKSEWISFLEIFDRKTSGKIHHLIYSVLDDNNLSLKDIAGVITTSGPGSYTGMRVSEGIVQILEWQKIPVYSFYHFEVPRLMGFDSGRWIANAFKKEVFEFYWDEASEQKALYKEQEYKIKLQKNIFSHFQTESYSENSEIIYTSEIIKKDPSRLFSIVIKERMRRELFYYRSLDQEFNRAK